MSESMTLAEDTGRVVCRNASKIGGAILSAPQAWDFDSNPFEGGPSEFGPEVKTAVIKHNYMLWLQDRTFECTLPFGARLHSVEAYTPGGGSTALRTMTEEDGDGTVLATEVASESAGHFVLQDITGAERIKRRTTANERVIKVSLDVIGQPIRGGEVFARYI